MDPKTSNDELSPADCDLLSKVVQFRAGPTLAGRVAAYATALERRTGKLSISDAVRGLLILGLEVAEAGNQKGTQP
jgi:hypothetical protein